MLRVPRERILLLRVLVGLLSFALSAVLLTSVACCFDAYNGCSEGQSGKVFMCMLAWYYPCALLLQLHIVLQKWPACTTGRRGPMPCCACWQVGLLRASRLALGMDM